MKNNMKHRIFSANKYTLDEHAFADMMTIESRVLQLQYMSVVQSSLGISPPKFFFAITCALTSPLGASQNTCLYFDVRILNDIV